jgi:hypothetical protein
MAVMAAIVTVVRAIAAGMIVVAGGKAGSGDEQHTGHRGYLAVHDGVLGISGDDTSQPHTVVKPPTPVRFLPLTRGGNLLVAGGLKGV